jgi:hypothetical protein
MPRRADGAVLIKIGRLNGVSVDAETGLARIGGGAIWSDVLGPAFEAGFGAPCGSSPGVGVVGYTLGGGFGLLARKHGLAIDAVRSARLVLADGSAVTASAEENRELFWALCGGGGAFGIVTELTMALPREPMVLGGMVMVPAARARQALALYREWTRELPDEVSASFSLMTFAPAPFVPEPLRGQAFAITIACAATDAETAQDLLRPIREQEGVVMDTFESLPFVACGAIFRDPVDPLPVIERGVLLRDLAEGDIDALLEAYGDPIHSPNFRFELRQLGGALGRLGSEACATGESRRAKFIFHVLGIPMPGLDPEAMHAHAQGCIAALGDSVLCRGPLNWMGGVHVCADGLQETFGEANFERMRRLKAEVDLQNRFRFAGAGAILAERG